MTNRRLRHSRSADFDGALDATASRRTARWTDVASDPNAAIAVARRAETLRAAWRDPIADRASYLIKKCANKRVLDVGCVAHDVARMSSTNWLHAKIAGAAASCLGVDVLEAGVDAMNALGYNAITHDLSQGVGPLRDLQPFEIIVAGELIEHVGSINMLFETAREILTEDGSLILTSPNPFAPDRVRAGQAGVVWENVDHILYAFPSGVAELAERHGLFLAEAATTKTRESAFMVAGQRLKAMRQAVKGNRWINVGYTTDGPRRVIRVGNRFEAAARQRAMNTRFCGETFVYVVQRPTTDTSAAP